jgi:hypothetical protein
MDEFPIALWPRHRFAGNLVPDRIVAEGARAGRLLDDLAAARWVQAYDSAWLDKDWVSLEAVLALDVTFVTPAAPEPMVGRVRVLESIRGAMRNVAIHEYNATDLQGYDCTGLGVITYRWQLDCTTGRERSQSTGRDVLVLRASDDRWLLAWRGQFRA